jgi:hypothetical protein
LDIPNDTLLAKTIDKKHGFKNLEELIENLECNQDLKSYKEDLLSSGWGDYNLLQVAFILMYDDEVNADESLKTRIYEEIKNIDHRWFIDVKDVMEVALTLIQR